MSHGFFLVLPLFILVSTFDSFSKQSITSTQLRQNHPDTIIIFLSRTQNTKVLAELIHDEVGGTLVELELENPYPENYQAIVEQVARENETGFLPRLKTEIENFDQFGVVFIGFPTWGMQLPPPMKCFLSQYDLSGKTVIPFNTNAGYGVGRSFETVERLCSNSTILEGFSTTGGVERDDILFVMEGEKKREIRLNVKAWLERINVYQLAND